MKIARVLVEGFRGFDQLDVRPAGHVLLAGEPRAGRSNLLSAIALVLDAEQQPRAMSEHDFFEMDTTRAIEIEVTLVDLGQALRQRFLDQVEMWDTASSELVSGVDDPSEIPDTAEPALRVAYLARWDATEEGVEQVRYWPKSSDASTGSFARVARRDRAALPFVRLGAGRPLNLAPQGGFRGLINSERPEDLVAVMDALGGQLEDLSGGLIAEEVIATSLETVLAPLRPRLGLDPTIEHSVQLAPDGGSLAAFLRSMLPTLRLDGGSFLPLSRHGSTATGQIEAAELVARGRGDGVVVVDDFGDTLDAPTAEHLARLLRAGSGQVWLSTRRPEMARAFETAELIRLARPHGQSAPSAYYGRRPSSRSERLAERELHAQLLPAMTASSLIVTEGLHDLIAYSAVGDRLMEDGGLGPASYGVRIVDAGGGNGGIDAIPRVCALAQSLGFRVVAVVDFDADEARAEQRLQEVLAAADAVVRLPPNTAVEGAVLDLEDDELIAALRVLNGSYQLPLPTGWDSLTGDVLRGEARRALKSNNGLHGPFVGCLDRTPPLAGQVVATACDCARGERLEPHVQL